VLNESSRVFYFFHPLTPLLSLPFHFMSNIYFAIPCLFMFLFCLHIFPLQSDVSGEVIKILREDGGKLGIFGCFFIFGLFVNFTLSVHIHLLCFTDPVGYGDALIVILPSFPGIKKLQ
jgi:hypothetical protein